MISVFPFRHEHVDQILEGRKTETRRMWKTALFEEGAEVAATVPERDCTFCWGTQIDPVQPGRVCTWCKGTRRLPARVFAKLRLDKVWLQVIGTFSYEDAIAEGYENVDDLWSALMSAYDNLDFGGEMMAVRFSLLAAYDEHRAR